MNDPVVRGRHLYELERRLISQGKTLREYFSAAETTDHSAAAKATNSNLRLLELFKKHYVVDGREIVETEAGRAAYLADVKLHDCH